MLPDNYENLAQSVIASDLMSNNILSAITTKNYWDAGNGFKPLMHLWYVGILVEFYIVMPLILIGVRWASKLVKVDYHKFAVVALFLLFAVSLILYLMPNFSDGNKFYYLHFRLYELILGGLVGLYVTSTKRRDCSAVSLIAFGALMIVVCSSLFLQRSDGIISAVSGQIAENMMVSKSVLLLTTVALAAIACRFSNISISNGALKKFSFVGKMSFSVFVWHQILLAFYRYYISTEMSVLFVAGLWCATLILSFASYYLIEVRIKPNWWSFGACCAVLILTFVPSWWIYTNAGVVRDVPELGLVKGQGEKGMFAKYCDRVYKYNVDFPLEDNGKLNVIVEGISFGRDFANVLLESKWADSINLSYIYQHDIQFKDRYSKADYIFSFCNKNDMPQFIYDFVKADAVLMGLSPKNYGECNGQVYSRRHQNDYLQSTVAINPNFYTLNEIWKSSWGSGNYIDLIELSTAPDGNIRIFSDDGQFISQDCRHLTQAGARFLAQRLEQRTTLSLL